MDIFDLFFEGGEAIMIIFKIGFIPNEDDFREFSESEVWETYHDGLKPKEWYEANLWIAEIPAPAAEIYLAFQNKDWRHGSCGGCI